MLLIERARVNTTINTAMPAFASVKLFTYQNPGAYRTIQCEGFYRYEISYRYR